jgi:hypothetical protein
MRSACALHLELANCHTCPSKHSSKPPVLNLWFGDGDLLDPSIDANDADPEKTITITSIDMICLNH